MPEQHRMILDYTDSNGIDTFVCQQCGRKVRQQWAPEFNTIVIDIGDASALHSASKGGLEIGDVDIYKTEWRRDEND